MKTKTEKPDHLTTTIILITMIIMILGVAFYIFRVPHYRRRAETGSHIDADENLDRTDNSSMREPTNTIPTEGNRKFIFLQN